MPKKFTVLSVIALSSIVLLGGGCSKKQDATTLALPASISVSNQSLGSDNKVIIDNTSTDDDSWIAIHIKENGQIGPVIGYTSLSSGTVKKIKIEIDRSNISPSLIAVLHYDRGQKGVFEFDGDGPVIKDQQVIMKEFNISNYADITKEPLPTSTGMRKEFILTVKQWSFSPSVIKVKKGDTVVLKLKSADVAHNLIIRDFNINTDIKPKEITTVEFVADKTGTFEFICDIRCGLGGRDLKGTIIIE